MSFIVFAFLSIVVIIAWFELCGKLIAWLSGEQRAEYWSGGDMFVFSLLLLSPVVIPMFLCALYELYCMTGASHLFN